MISDKMAINGFFKHMLISKNLEYWSNCYYVVNAKNFYELTTENSNYSLEMAIICRILRISILVI